MSRIYQRKTKSKTNAKVNNPNHEENEKVGMSYPAVGFGSNPIQMEKEVEKPDYGLSIAIEEEKKEEVYERKGEYFNLSISIGGSTLGKLKDEGDKNLNVKGKVETNEKKDTSKSGTTKKAQKELDLGPLLLFDNWGFSHSLDDKEFAVKVFFKSRDKHSEIKVEDTLCKLNIEKGDFEIGKLEGTLKALTAINIGSFSVEGGALLKIEINPNKDAIRSKLMGYFGKKISKEVIEEAAEKILTREAEKQGIKLISKEAFQKVLSKVNPALALLSAFETGWSIGTLLRKYTVAGEIADKEMENLSGFRDKYQKSGTAGKIGWSIIYSPKIGWTLVKGGVKGVAGAAGKAVGDEIYKDDNAMAMTDGDILEKYGLHTIEIDEKLKYFKDIGTGWVTESEEERLVKIFEYSTSEDRLQLFKDSDVFRVFKNELDGVDRKRFIKLLGEARGEEKMRISDSVVQQDNLKQWILKLNKDANQNPLEFQNQEKYINLFLKDLETEISDANPFEMPILLQYKYEFQLLNEKLKGRKKLDLLPLYVYDLLKTQSKLDWYLRSKLNPYDIPDYAESELIINSLKLEYSKEVVLSNESKKDNSAYIDNLEISLIHEIEAQISFLEKYLDHFKIKYTY